MFLAIDGTFWIQLINFGVFFLILNALFLRPVVRAIAERRAYIDGVAADYDRYVAQIKKLDEEAAHLTAEARRSAADAFAAARAEANKEADALRAGYAAQAQAIVEGARTKLRGERDAAEAQRPALAASLADLLLQRVRGEGAGRA